MASPHKGAKHLYNCGTQVSNNTGIQTDKYTQKHPHSTFGRSQQQQHTCTFKPFSETLCFKNSQHKAILNRKTNTGRVYLYTSKPVSVSLTEGIGEKTIGGTSGAPVANANIFWSLYGLPSSSSCKTEKKEGK